MIKFESVEPLQIRVPTIVHKSLNLQAWDLDNLYVQRTESAIKRSYTLKSVANNVAKFIAGEGFNDPNVGKIIVNSKGFGGETLNKLLRKISKPASRYSSFAIHFSYDLNYRISAMEYISIEYPRFPNPNEDGTVDTILTCDNWEQQPRKNIKNKSLILEYPRFNPDPEVVEAEIEFYGGIDNYPGQVLFYTPEPYQYPTATFDPVLDHAQTQDELGQFKLGYTQNGMMSTLAIVYSGEFEGEEEKRDFNKLLARKKGAKNANSTIGLQDKSGKLKLSDMLQSLQPANLDRLFEFTEKSAVNAIIENFAWPKILIGVLPESGMFNQQSMSDAYTYANSITRIERSDISELFSYILKYWATPVDSDCSIKELQYTTAAPVNGPTPSGTPSTVPNASTDPVQDSPQINRIMQNLTAAQSQALDRIIRKYKRGVYTRPLAKWWLQQSVGINDTDCEMWLNEADTQMLEEGTLNNFIRKIKKLW